MTILTAAILVLAPVAPAQAAVTSSIGQEKVIDSVTKKISVRSIITIKGLGDVSRITLSWGSTATLVSTPYTATHTTPGIRSCGTGGKINFYSGGGEFSATCEFATDKVTWRPTDNIAKNIGGEFWFDLEPDSLLSTNGTSITLHLQVNGGSAISVGTLTQAPLAQSALSIVSTSGTFGSPINLVHSGGSGSGAVTYSVTNAGTAGCTVSGTQLTSSSAGTCSVTATKASDANYSSISSAATQITFAKATRSLTFGATTSYTLFYGDTQQVTATASSGNDDGSKTYSASGTACSVSETGLITVTASTGSCTVSASISGGTNYLDAQTQTQVSVNGTVRAITITGKSETFDFGSAFSPEALGGASLVSPQTVNQASTVFEFTGTNGTNYGPSQDKPTAAGEYSITPTLLAISGGSASDYNITYVPGIITISKASRTLTLSGTTSDPVPFGNTLTVTATPNAGVGDGAVAYSRGQSDACTVDDSSGLVSVTKVSGTCVITATIDQGTNYLTATSSFTFTLAKKSITLKTADFEVTEGGDVVPATQVSVGSLVGSDAISSATFTFRGTGTTTYGPSTVAPTAIGTYDVTPSVPVFGAGSAANYTIAFAAGTLTISAQPPAPSSSSGAVAAQPVAGPAIAGVTARGSDNGKGSFLRVRLDKTPGAFEQLTVVVRLLDLKGELLEELRIPVSQGSSMLEIPIDRRMGQFNAVAQISSSIAANTATNAATMLRPDPLQQSTIREATEERPARLLGKRLSRPVLFAAESAKLTPAMKGELRKAARAAKESGSRLAVTGFHSLSGQGEAFEQSLAEKRALRVARYLRNRGFDNWILYHGLSSQDGEQFRGQPQRVEIRVLKR